ncbi:MAG: hypothetical protein ACSHX8_10740 [Opitutaceae bacterium]
MSTLTVHAEKMKEAGILLIFKLTVESSYSEDLEREASEKFDTIQWWIGSSGAWRIKTYAIDSDIHPYRITTKKEKEELVQLATANTKKTYGDVTSEIIRIDVQDGWDNETVLRLLKEHSLKEKFEWVEAGYLLWVPDDSTYTTQSKPQPTNKTQ